MSHRYSELVAAWRLDPSVVFLNHGSFGACPTAVLEYQNQLRLRLEGQPVQFLARELPARLAEARQRLAEFAGASGDDLVFVTNATQGVNTVLRSIELAPGDELLVTDHEYNACRNALDFVAQRAGARVVVANVPFPLESRQEVVTALQSAVTRRTRLALVDHVTSQTGLVFPVEEIVRALAALGVDTLIDGAHAPGMVALDLRRLQPAYYTGNCHKWLCAPKGAAFLYVRPDRQSTLRPLSISHGANQPQPGRSRFQVEGEWTGTFDPTAVLSVPAAIQTVANLCEGGWPEVQARNRALAIEARRILCGALAIPPPAPDDMVGSLAAVPIADSTGANAEGPTASDSLQASLYREARIEVPVITWPSPPRRVIRVSAQLYNHESQYRYLAEELSRRIR